ncbi:MAG: hypothetical protein ABII75_09890 [Candidatus Omnitrophota bacterium]
MSLIQDKAFEALKVAVRKVIDQHKKSGLPLAIWEDGRVKYISADEALKRHNG